MKTIDLVYFNAGGGHRAAAEALATTIRDMALPWCVRPVNLFDLLDREQRFHDWTGWQPEDYYNKRLAAGWTLGLAQELKVLQGAIRVAHPWLVKTLTRHWAASEPDLVVSLVPNFNRAMQQAVRAALPGVPYCTVLTDWADYPPRFWMESEPGAHIVCGTGQAVRQAIRLGHAPSHIHHVSGMILRPSFYQEPSLDRPTWRQAMGLPAEEPVGLVMFGGHGSSAMKTISQALSDRPLILLCGRNDALLSELRQQQVSAPRVLLGHTQQVADFMRMADYFIGKPGPGSLSEALHCGLPIVTTRNTATLPQERFNANRVTDEGYGVVARSFGQMKPAVDRLLHHYNQHRARVLMHSNRAVFEVVEILAMLLRQSHGGVDMDPPRPTATAPLLAEVG